MLKTSFNSITGRLIVAVALMAILVVFVHGASAQAAQHFVTYTENDDTPVLTLSATDPEGVTPIVWSFLEDASGDQDLGIITVPEEADDVDDADVADHASFNIEDGVLTFKSPPSYEADSASGTGDDAKTYRVVVQASDGGATDKLSWFKVVVTVTDEEEGGKVEWTVDHDGGDTHTATTPKLMQFQAGASLIASVTDADGPDPLTNVRWQWYRSSSKTSMGTMIDGAESATYTASDTSTSNDVGMYLRAMATYSDRRGPNKTASLVSDYPVQAARADNSVPEFLSAAATRGIPEGPSGRNVGAPVTATDADNDLLNYHISGGTDATSFKIDQETGQITTAAALDFSDDAGGPTDDEYVIEVSATDSAGGVSDPAVTVTITVTDVNEKPTFSEGPEGMAADHTEGATVIDGDPDAADVQTATYTAADPEGANVKLTLSGDDKDMFELADDTDTGAGAMQVLSFKSEPDFEMPADADGDNIYEVTVVASDGEMTAMRSLTVKVIDADETGMVELSSQDALIGVELTATLKDSDGGVPDPAKFTGVTWVWERDDDTTNDATNSGAEEVISGAKSASYTPDADDRGMHLRAIAMYTDRTYDEDNIADNNDAPFMSFMNTAVSDSTTPVRNNPANQAPKFTEGASTFRVVEENRMAVMADPNEDLETSTDAPADNVGEPVTATDADDDTPTYTLGGADKDMFRIRNNGQIEVGDKAKLDYEKKKHLRVTVIADDGYGASNSTASITVTIYVTDLDEAPEIMDRADRAAMGEQSVTYEENDDKAVLTLTASDPERVTPIVWSFLEDASGDQDLGIITVPEEADDVDDADVADHASFNIEDGVLTFKSPPSYEADSASGTGDDAKTYRVVVQASDGGATNKLSWFKVTVTVTNKEEDGEVSWTVDHNNDGSPDTPKLMQFQVKAALTASVIDGDGEAVIIKWQWYRSSSKTSMGTEIKGAESATYTTTDSGSAPDAGGDDRGKYIHVMATYTVDGGSEETASLASDYPVQAIREEDNTVPAFSSTAISRRVTEGPSGRNVGASVTATDADSDLLNYHISGGTDATSFKIDQKTGQITTAAALDFSDDAGGPTDDEYVIEVSATDSAGGVSDPAVTVTITVTDLNDKPTFSTGTEGMAPDQVEGMTAIDNDPDIAGVQAFPSYTAADPEGANVTLTLSGDDKDMFELAADTDTGAGAMQVLSFKSEPDFEMPGDKNKDNIYEVTVVASDGEMTAMRSLTVKVVDMDEAGMVELSSQDALIGVELTATLKDSDGGVPDPAKFTGVTWQWYSLSEVNTELDSTATGAVIKRAASPSYTPDADDRGRYLKAMVTYTDRTYDEDNIADNNDAPFMSFMNTAVSDSTTPVRNNPANQAPKFTEGASTFRVVEENRMAVMADPNEDLETSTDAPADNVGEPVTATDADDDTPTYTLGGADKDMFRIRNNGQIEIGDKAMLDYEKKNRYEVTVTATDSSNMANNSASIDVTIYVTDLDEAPTISTGLAVSGPPRADYAEDRTDAVATYTASGPDAAQATWSLSGADAGDFDISSSGMLTFMSSPDYETPADADGDNVYMVTVEADDGTYMDSHAVTITVTNVNDAPEFASATATRSVAENTAAGEDIGEPVAATDDDGDTLTYTLGGDDADSFDMATSTGQLMTSAELDFETTGSYTVTVTASDGTVEASIRVTVMVTDEGPEFASATTTRSVAENTDAGMYVGEPVAADGDTLTYTLGGDDADSFDIATSTGQLMTKAGLDFETAESHTVTVTASDGTEEATITVTITVTDVDENVAPEFDSATTTRSVAENTAAGENIGEPVAAMDANAGDTLAYTLGGDDAASFDIATSTGQLMTKAELDFETAESHTVTVTASDGTEEATITVTITVTDVDENVAPEFDSATTTRSVAENTAAGENIGEPVAAMDANAGDTLAYTLGGDDAASFDIATSTGQLMTKAELDFETAESHTVTVTASDGTEEATITVTITVTDVDENVAPEFDSATTTRSVAENTAAGENIGEPVAAMDANAGDTLAYTLGGDDAASFDIATSTGQLMTKAELDFETAESHTVTVTASDGTEEATITVTITVTDVDEIEEPDLMTRYDADDTGDIDKDEAIAAINDYLYGEGDAAITKADAIEVINLYLYPPSS